MKKIINGKKYDTDTAKEVGYSNNGLLSTDIDYIEETLYQKKTGEFFLYGEGGARTKYADYRGEMSSYHGYKIAPLTVKEAKKWAEDHLTVDEYEGIFGEVEE